MSAVAGTGSGAAARGNGPIVTGVPGSVAVVERRATKKTIVDFVARVTRKVAPTSSPPPSGSPPSTTTARSGPSSPSTSSSRSPRPRKELAPKHPEWKQKQPFKGVLEGDMKAVAASGERGLIEVMAATHAGMTTEEFADDRDDWIATARHPRFERPYTELVYQPMLELLAYLRANGFKTFIVSGGGVEFMRPWAERVYGIPPEQVVGSRSRCRYEVRDGKPVLVRLAGDRPRRRQGGQAGRHSAGDRPSADRSRSGTLTATSRCSSGRRPLRGPVRLLVHHTDAEREWAYDRTRTSASSRGRSTSARSAAGSSST